MSPDIFFLSYSESNADNNWKHLQKWQPKAQRLHGIKGIKNAHQAIAQAANSDYFFVIDGDNHILPEFDFTLPQSLNRQSLYVWRAQNPVNDLCYGFGGVKLYNKWLLLENKQSTSVDIATSIAPIYIPVMNVASITLFNATPLEAWRGAFRECAKLSLNLSKHPHDTASSTRLNVWKTKGQDQLNGSYALKGANMGHQFSLINANSPSELALINDFSWLNQQFDTLKI